MVSIRGQKRLDLGKAAVVRYDNKGNHFEILVDPKLAWEYREGKDIEIRDVLLGYYIFSDALRGQRLTDSELFQEIFNESILFFVKIKIRTNFFCFS